MDGRSLLELADVVSDEEAETARGAIREQDARLRDELDRRIGRMER